MVSVILSVHGLTDNLDTGVLDTEDPNHDDFELWSPSEGRSEACLFGRQVSGSPRYANVYSWLCWTIDTVPSTYEGSELCYR